VEQRPPLPPFTLETAKKKIQAAEDAWNAMDPERCAQAYTRDTEWRNRDEFINGRDEVVAFLKRKWAKEHEYRLKKTYWAHTESRIAVRFEYEWHDEDGQWYRSHGNENWEFDVNGLMKKRYASINDEKIDPSERRLK
jgi:nuclear transport factor 2 (NTF2) superfamily protein